MYYLGIDPHKQQHVVVICDGAGREVARQAFRANAGGYQAALAWAQERAAERIWGCENPQAYGRGFAQWLVAHGEHVRSVSALLTGRYRWRSLARGKTDEHDALAVARATLQEGERLPVVEPEGPAAGLRVLVEHYDNLKSELTRARNRLHAQLLALDPDYQQYGPLTDAATLRGWLGRARPGGELAGLRWQVVVATCERMLQLAVEMAALEKQIAREVKRLDPAPLLAISGVGPYLAAKLIGETGHPHLFRDEAAWAQYAGLAPLPCSSGQNQRDRVNPGGNRQLNYAIHQVMLTQLRRSPEARAYFDRKCGEGKTPRAAKRCLKRRIARQIFHALRQVAALQPRASTGAALVAS